MFLGDTIVSSLGNLVDQFVCPEEPYEPCRSVQKLTADNALASCTLDVFGIELARCSNQRLSVHFSGMPRSCTSCAAHWLGIDFPTPFSLPALPAAGVERCRCF